MIKRVACFFLLVIFHIEAKPKQPFVTLQLHDLNFLKNGPDDWESNRLHLLNLLSKEKDPKVRQFIASRGAHGEWTARELTKELKNYSLFKWNLKAVPFELANLNKEPRKIKNPSIQQMRENALNNIKGREEALLKNGPIPDIVVSPTGAYFVSESTEDLKKERQIMAEEFKKFFERYPQTLFVHSAGNSGCKTEDSPQYNWSDIDLENLVVVGSCNSNGQKSKFSNYGPDVDIYGVGEDVVIDEKELYRFPIFRKSRKYTIQGTSFSTPRIANLIAKELINMRRENPKATALDAFKKIRSISPPVKPLINTHKKPA